MAIHRLTVFRRGDGERVPMLLDHRGVPLIYPTLFATSQLRNADAAVNTTRNKLADIHRQSWKNLEAVELATFKWVNWFNHRRRLGPIGNIPPAEAEAVYYRQQVALPKAA